MNENHSVEYMALSESKIFLAAGGDSKVLIWRRPDTANGKSWFFVGMFRRVIVVFYRQT